MPRFFIVVLSHYADCYYAQCHRAEWRGALTTSTSSVTVSYTWTILPNANDTINTTNTIISDTYTSSTFNNYALCN